MSEAGGIAMRPSVVAGDDEEKEETHWTDHPPTFLEQLALRWFGGMSRKRIRNHPELGIKLSRAGIATVPVAYLASVYMRTFMVFLVGMPFLLFYVAISGGNPDPRLLIPLVSAPGLFAAITYSYAMLRPDLDIRRRGRDLEENLPYALNFMAALAGAGVVTIEVWAALGAQPVYGEVAVESRAIYRDARILGKDLVTAMKDAAKRSPSQQFEEFLNGSVNTITSGGDLRSYLLSKSEHYTQENRRKQRSFLESLGVMAESYVVVGAAAPLFMIVVISIMALTSSGGPDPISLLNLLILLGMPVIHGTFSYVIGSMRPD